MPTSTKSRRTSRTTKRTATKRGTSKRTGAKTRRTTAKRTRTTAKKTRRAPGARKTTGTATSGFTFNTKSSTRSTFARKAA